MTDATVLADALVKAGIGQRRMDGDYGLLNWDYPNTVPSHRFITDWRVAGMVLESMDSSEVCDVVEASFGSVRELITPRAIIEAWYEARQ